MCIYTSSNLSISAGSRLERYPQLSLPSFDFRLISRLAFSAFSVKIIQAQYNLRFKKTFFLL